MVKVKLIDTKKLEPLYPPGDTINNRVLKDMNRYIEIDSENRLLDFEFVNRPFQEEKLRMMTVIQLSRPPMSISTSTPGLITLNNGLSLQNQYYLQKGLPLIQIPYNRSIKSVESKYGMYVKVDIHSGVILYGLCNYGKVIKELIRGLRISFISKNFYIVQKNDFSTSLVYILEESSSVMGEKGEIIKGNGEEFRYEQVEILEGYSLIRQVYEQNIYTAKRQNTDFQLFEVYFLYKQSKILEIFENFKITQVNKVMLDILLLTIIDKNNQKQGLLVQVGQSKLELMMKNRINISKLILIEDVKQIKPSRSLKVVIVEHHDSRVAIYKINDDIEGSYSIFKYKEFKIENLVSINVLADCIFLVQSQSPSGEAIEYHCCLKNEEIVALEGFQGVRLCQKISKSLFLVRVPINGKPSLFKYSLEEGLTKVINNLSKDRSIFFSQGDTLKFYEPNFLLFTKIDSIFNQWIYTVSIIERDQDIQEVKVIHSKILEDNSGYLKFGVLFKKYFYIQNRIDQNQFLFLDVNSSTLKYLTSYDGNNQFLISSQQNMLLILKNPKNDENYILINPVDLEIPNAQEQE